MSALVEGNVRVRSHETYPWLWQCQKCTHWTGGYMHVHGNAALCQFCNDEESKTQPSSQEEPAMSSNPYIDYLDAKISKAAYIHECHKEDLAQLEESCAGSTSANNRGIVENRRRNLKQSALHLAELDALRKLLEAEPVEKFCVTVQL